MSRVVKALSLEAYAHRAARGSEASTWRAGDFRPASERYSGANAIVRRIWRELGSEDLPSAYAMSAQYELEDTIDALSTLGKDYSWLKGVLGKDYSWLKGVIGRRPAEYANANRNILTKEQIDILQMPVD